MGGLGMSGPSAKDLRDVAWALDALVKLTRCLLEPIAHAEGMGAAEVTVTCDVTKHGEPMSSETARQLLDWVTDDEMQDDLRAWADALETGDTFASTLSELSLRNHQLREAEFERDRYRRALDRIAVYDVPGTGVYRNTDAAEFARRVLDGGA